MLVQRCGKICWLGHENLGPSYFFIFYSEQLKKTWVIPSLDIVNRESGRIASKNARGINAGKYSINMAGHSKTDNKAIAIGANNEEIPEV